MKRRRRGEELHACIPTSDVGLGALEGQVQYDLFYSGRSRSWRKLTKDPRLARLAFDKLSRNHEQ